ncbi:MAG: LysR family transcriptional regulator [Polyangiaceae bacterium]
MTITLEQARALDAVARFGTFQKAAASLHKGHTAVLYALSTLEASMGLTLLDRSRYRTKLTAEGEALLGHARHLLSAEKALIDACAEIRSGWEPRLRVVFDGIFPAEPILRAVAKIGRAKATTRVEVSSEFLGGAEEAFVRDEADFLVAVVPPSTEGLKRTPLPPIRARLVAHRDHPLVSGDAVTSAELARHTLLTVRGSDPRLSLRTETLSASFVIRLNDFYAKKAAILLGLGFGWMPENLIRAELRSKKILPVPWSEGAIHIFRPQLYVRADKKLGRAATMFRDALLSAPPVAA